MKRQTVLVTDGEQRAALAIVRSLGKAGHRVYTCSTCGTSIAGASRYSRREGKVSDALSDPAGFVADVKALIRTWGISCLLPVSDAALLSILPERGRLGHAGVPFPDVETFRRISDKALVLAAASRLGIEVPQQWVLRHRDDLVTVSANAIRFPLVIKPSRSIGESRGRRTRAGVVYAEHRAQLEEQVARVDDAAYPLLLQQRIVGPGVGVFLLLWDGRTLAQFSHRRLREKPPSGGVSVYRESILPDPALVDRSRALLDHFGWQGVAMVEYKIDRTTGTPYLMEINGRFWGSLQLAIDAGVDFPRLLLSAAAGEHPAPVLDYHARIRSRWWWGDVEHLVARLRSSNHAIPPDANGKFRAVTEFLTLWRPGDRSEVFRVADPWPFVRETVDWVRAL